MKTQKAKLGFTFLKTALSLTVALLATLSPAQATLLFSGVDLGAAGRTKEWAIFALTGGISISDTTSGRSFANPTVQGDVGVSGNSITIAGTTKVAGTAYVKTGGLLRRTGTAAVQGNGGLAVQSAPNDTFMNNVKNDALAATAQAGALSPDLAGATFGGVGFGPSVINSNGGVGTLTDSAGGSHIVLSLSDFVLSGGASFTLTGTAATTFVFNVSNKFSLVGGSVLLSGVAPENVLFNILGSGLDLTLSAAANFNGVILAPSRTVNLSGGASVTGTIVAGKVNLSGGSTVTHLPFVSP